MDEYDMGNYDGKVVKLTADIGTAEDPVTTKVGCMTDGRILSYNGTFDGQGHTVYVNYTDDAPFMYTSDATIQNLHVAGNIIAGNKYASGLVSQAYNNLTIRNCHSSVNISGSSTDQGFLCGFVGIHRKNGEAAGDITITGCLFDGSITTTNGTTRCAGFVGWTKYPSHVTISNSLLAPTSISSGILDNTFVTYDTAGGTPDISNTYFIPVTNLTANQGKQAQTITAGENVISLAISGAPTEYNLSGITAYEGNSGLKYNSLLYAGSGDVVNLALTHAEPEEGEYFYQYTTSAGSLFTNSPTSATLIMPDGTTAISAIIDATIPTIFLTANLASGAYWSTFYSNADNFQAPEGTQVFTVNLTGTTLTLNEISDRIVKSGEGVVLKQTTTSSTATTTIPMTLTNATPTGDFSGNSLTGTMTSITNPGNAYVLGGKNGAGFYKLSASGTIGANKAYLTYSGALAREFFGFEEETTALTLTDSEKRTVNNDVYDLQGRCVAQPTKGLYIVNGKMTVIK